MLYGITKDLEMSSNLEGKKRTKLEASSNKNNVHPGNKVTTLDAEQQNPLSIKTKYKLIRLISRSRNSIINFCTLILA